MSFKLVALEGISEPVNSSNKALLRLALQSFAEVPTRLLRLHFQNCANQGC